MCKEIPVLPVNRVVDLKRIIGKKWRAEEELNYLVFKPFFQNEHIEAFPEMLLIAEVPPPIHEEQVQLNLQCLVYKARSYSFYHYIHRYSIDVAVHRRFTNYVEEGIFG
jgi:hypothetical protein